MRVIAGKAKGHKLKAPAGQAVRPTSDKIKGAVFNVLAHAVPLDRFLDLFAGSGAIGIEAWSRGAEQVTFIEKDAKILQVLQANLNKVGYDQALVLHDDWQYALSKLSGQTYSVIYADPPFASDYYPLLMERIAASGLLAKRGILCLEHPSKMQLQPPAPWCLFKYKRYGATAVTFLSLAEKN